MTKPNKRAKSVEKWAIKKNGRITWICQDGKPLGKGSVEFLESGGGKVIRVLISELPTAKVSRKRTNAL